MQDIVNKDFLEKPKRFWSYVKSKKQEATGVSSLVDKDGFLHSDSQQKAEILNNQFQSVYTAEDLTTCPSKGESPYPTMEKITIHSNEAAEKP